MIKVGIDLSTTNTGIVCIDENGNYLMRLEKLWQGDYWETYWQISQVANWLFKTYDHKDMVIGIELANFKNAKLTSKFNLLAGMIMGIFYESCNRFGTIKFKLFNANEWHRLIGITPQMERATCKYRARVFAGEHGMLNSQNLPDDLTDAYCIAYLLNQCRDNQQITQQKHEREAKAKKSYKAEMRKRLLDANKRARLNEIIKRYEILLASGKRLTKAQINAYEKAKRGLENEQEHNIKY